MPDIQQYPIEWLKLTGPFGAFPMVLRTEVTNDPMLPPVYETTPGLLMRWAWDAGYYCKLVEGYDNYVQLTKYVRTGKYVQCGSIRFMSYYKKLPEFENNLVYLVTLTQELTINLNDIIHGTGMKVSIIDTMDKDGSDLTIADMYFEDMYHVGVVKTTEGDLIPWLEI